MAKRGAGPQALRTSFRCAVYTRKSTEEGLEQEFNSLDAQREACEAYILSQRHEGWSLVKTAYDDGGFSGGSMDRPALKRLLADVEASKIDVIVVYKVDRLTRALSDFAKIVETLDARGASFVSVTQAFNTTSSMGRLTLNVLLSFAQFEREVTAERIRDKFAASKKRGMWMGGNPPLGYEVKDRKLVINEAEAQQVRHIMTRYVELGSIRLLADELHRAGYRTKQRGDRGGVPFSRGALSHMLGNPIYAGSVSHKGTVYDGEHDALVDPELWTRVSAKLAQQRNGENCIRAPKTSLLVGKIVDGEGRKMTPSHTSKAGKRYRYYVTHPSEMITTGSVAWRISAPELERIIIDRLKRWFNDRRAMMDIAGVDAPVTMIATAKRRSLELDQAEHRQRLTSKLISHIALGQHEIIIALDQEAVRQALEVESLAPDQTLELSTNAMRIRQGKDVRMIIADEGARSADSINKPLLSLLAEAQDLHQKLIDNPEHTVASLADGLGKCRRRSGQLLRVALIAPDLVAQCIAGTQPASLTTKKLLTTDLPINWREQRKALGFA